MEKIISINGQDVRFKATGALPLRYKAAFGRDLFADMAALESMQSIEMHSEEGVTTVPGEMDLSKLDTELFYNLVWTMAKCADASIPPVLDWLDRFEAFPVFEVFNELQEMLVKSFQTTKN